MRAPVAIWVDEKGFSKDVHFFSRKIYLSFRIGFMRHRRENTLLQSRPLLARLFS
jgi:hypothetical protein